MRSILLARAKFSSKPMYQSLPTLFLCLLASGSLIACAEHNQEQLTPPGEISETQLNLGNHTFKITTEVPEAQAAFNRGLTLAYAFSHLSAEKEFRKAAELDPGAPMPWWGVALVNGPHINYPFVPQDKAQTAWDALLRAQDRASRGTTLEQDLITALSSRYVAQQPDDRTPLDTSYAAAMAKVQERYPRNADVTTLYAEALMDLHPWDLWESNGTAKPWTSEILATLDKAIALNGAHPGAHHLYIHASEASPTPEKGVPSADRLRNLVPDAGHLVHMPGHIYVRVGRWEDAAVANIKAIAADKKFRKLNPNPGFYSLYMIHNHHFLTFVRMMQGRSEDALRAANEMVAGIPPEFIRDYGAIADGFMATVPKVLMRFGRWEEALAQPEPPANLPLARALRRYVRTSAFSALGRLKEAQAERGHFLKAVKAVPQEATFGNNSAHTILKLAQLVIDGETAAQKGKLSDAIKHLEKAARLEDTLFYDEPPDWIIPVRHTLGVTLLRAGKAKEAEQIYLADLKRFPRNGWSLYGLSRALEIQGKVEEANAAREEFKKEWEASDIKIKASCLCQPGV